MLHSANRVRTAPAVYAAGNGLRPLSLSARPYGKLKMPAGRMARAAPHAQLQPQLYGTKPKSTFSIAQEIFTALTIFRERNPHIAISC